MAIVIRASALGLLYLGLLVSAVADTGPVQRDHIEVELLAATRSVQPGQPLLVGLRLLPDPGWHTYWQNPGDSGLPTSLDWTLPEGVSAGEIAWPYPEAMPFAHLINYGYEGEHLLPVTLDVPDDLVPGSELRLEAWAEWLVCEEICIPGDARLVLTLPVRDQAPVVDPANAALFDWARRRQPEEVDWPARFNTEGGQLSVQVQAPVNAPEWAFFSALENFVDHAEPAMVTGDNGQILVAQKLSPFITGDPAALPLVLVDTAAGQAYRLVAVPGQLVSLGEPAPGQTGWLLAIVLAVAGGVLLNLMPCVFPVLSIKAMSVVSGAGRDQRSHGLAYTAGVMLSFAGLAGILLALRAGGEAIGWGFQLQSPLVVGVLVYVLFALALSLSGLFDFGTRLMGIGQGLTERGGLGGSFSTGVLACIVASPCTAPFMGTALGAAVLMPWPMAMAIFLALGLGLALPMLLLSFSPALAARLPRPGPWMETFKQAMAFPLYLAVVWLLWVLARQTDANGLAAVLAGMVMLAFALWLSGRRDRGPNLAVVRHVAVALSLVFAFAALGTAIRFQSDNQALENAWWEPYRAERLSELRADPERAVLVNMTADWCVTCLVNERVALNTDAVRQAMTDHDVVYIKGDWTRRDPAITDYLAEFGRNGVPLYVVYPRDGGQPRVLPQVLSPGLVVQALQTL
jgi:thiol:disulfide interchange protein/DsbC/DsbD-like thiol-disulfide interchange protein